MHAIKYVCMYVCTVVTSNKKMLECMTPPQGGGALPYMGYIACNKVCMYVL